MRQCAFVCVPLTKRIAQGNPEKPKKPCRDSFFEKYLTDVADAETLLRLMHLEAGAYFVHGLNLARSKNMDLVMVSGNVQNPVCKIMDYGKYKFEQSKREKESRKKQKIFEIKEIRVTPNTEEHDFNFKLKNAQKFLSAGSKVKITARFRGRELNYVKLGEEVLNKFVTNLSEVATVEKPAKLEGKNMSLILAPFKEK